MNSGAINADTVGHPSEIIPVYVWELPVRITHWLIFGAIAVLAVTGFYISYPFITVTGPASDHFVMGTVKVIHFYAAIVFVLSVLARIGWMFTGNRYSRWYQFIPITRPRLRHLVRTLKFYLFLGKEPPGSVGHNALAGVTYSALYLVFFLMIATGFAMYSQSAAVGSPMRAFRFLIPLFGGLQSARWIHHVGMWLLIAFPFHHVYSALMVSVVEGNATVESIFSGYKTVTRETLTKDAANGG
jgi:Ni/Fe-hydrogenase 1 B-type cytochrome subunit